MFKKQSYLAAAVVFCTFICLNGYVIYSLLHFNPTLPTIDKDATITSEEETDIKYKRIPTPIVSETKSEQIKYSVKSGDTLWDISLNYKTDVTSIINYNNLESPDNLKVGQELIIPASAAGDSKSSDAIVLASRGGTPSMSSFTGSLPVSGKLSSKYGKRGSEFHKGIDIAASTGFQVHAFADGKVIFSGWDNGGYGNLVIISHGNGYETYYAHNSKLIVKSGQMVSKGQVISKVGNTGDSDGSHCHFEIRRKGSPVNPLTYIK